MKSSMFILLPSNCEARGTLNQK